MKATPTQPTDPRTWHDQRPTPKELRASIRADRIANRRRCKPLCKFDRIRANMTPREQRRVNDRTEAQQAAMDGRVPKGSIRQAEHRSRRGDLSLTLVRSKP